MIGVFGQSEHGLQLRLAATLQADACHFSELDDFFDDMALLIHLDRIDGGVSAFIRIFLSRVGEFFVQRFYSRSQYVGETKE